jgi:hypothetical protein
MELSTRYTLRPAVCRHRLEKSAERLIDEGGPGKIARRAVYQFSKWPTGK